MSQRPMSPYSLSTARGKLRIWGGDGEDENEQGNGDDGELTPEEQQLKDLQEKVDKAEQATKDADKRAKDFEKQLKDKELEGADEAEKTAAERDDYKEKYEKLLKIVETSVIDTAISNLSSQKDKQGNPKYNWHDVQAVRTFLDKENIKLDIDTGDIDGLEPQLKEIATKRPYLLVAKEEQDDQNGRTPPPPPGGPATGSHPTGGSARQRETDRTKLGSKYKLPGFIGASNVGARPM